MHAFIVRPLAEMINKYNEKLSAVGDLVYEGRPYCTPVSRDELIDLTRTMMIKLMSRRTKPGARLVGDKTPANAQIIDDLAVLFPDMRFISMLRDPRDVAASRLGHAVRTGHADAQDPGSALYAEVVRAAAVDWRLSVERTQAFAARRPGQLVSVRYEDLLADPAGELSRVFEFLRARTRPEELAAIVSGSSFEAFSGGRSAGQENKASFYRKGVAGDWRNHLTDAALQTLIGECGPAMRRAGYLTDEAQAAA